MARACVMCVSLESARTPSCGMDGTNPTAPVGYCHFIMDVSSMDRTISDRQLE